jgi:hypothetical protein
MIDYIIILSFILISLGLVPIIIQITANKSARDISIGTPIIFIIAFLSMCITSYIKRSYKLICVFAIGLAVSIVLLIQKILFDKQL